MAFLTLVNQGPGLIGAHGLLPAASSLAAAAAELGGRGAAFAQLPSLFWLSASDTAIAAVGWTGVVLSALVSPATQRGDARRLVGAVHLGRGHRAGVLRLRLGDPAPRDRRPGASSVRCSTGGRFRAAPPPAVAVWLFRWQIVRIMLGAGLIKMRGNACWRDLTCLDVHFETQPIPNPLSPLFHFLPHWVAQAAACCSTTSCELVGAVLAVWPAPPPPCRRRARWSPADLLLASGNLSFLNWLTLVPIVACFDDGLARGCAPRCARAPRARAAATPSRAQGAVVAVWPSWSRCSASTRWPNLLSGARHEHAFTPLPLVNTYGAFGKVGRERTSWCSRAHRRGSHRRHALARVRVPVQAGRSGAPAVLDEPVPPPPRLAAVVRGDGLRRATSPGPCTWSWKLLDGRSARRWRCSRVDPFADAPPR